jgi:hypothetical protein
LVLGRDARVTDQHVPTSGALKTLLKGRRPHIVSATHVSHTKNCAFLASGAVPIVCAERVVFAQLHGVDRQEVRKKTGAADVVKLVFLQCAPGCKSGENPHPLFLTELLQSWPAQRLNPVLKCWLSKTITINLFMAALWINFVMVRSTSTS